MKVRDLSRPLKESTNDFWFEDGFPTEIHRFILTNPFADHQMRCQDESARWAIVLSKKFPRVAIGIVEGEYLDTDDENEMGHTWVTVGGYKFDPTAAQFMDFPNMNWDKYREMEEFDVETYMEYNPWACDLN